MKNFLAKFASALTVLAMTFGMTGVALATPGFNMVICHMEGNDGYHTIVINSNAWPAHQSHGDYQGACQDNEGGDNDNEGNPDPVCLPELNLIVNGGFELPVVTAGQGWDVFPDGTPDLGWGVSWNGAFAGAPAVANLELHRNVYNPDDEGDQHAELDTDWAPGGSEQASVKIYQSFQTIPGATYHVSYAFSPRPNTPASDNALEVFIDNVSQQTQGPVAGGAVNSWNTYGFDFVAVNPMTTIRFQDNGTPNTLGTFLDDVSVNCTDEPQEPEVCYESGMLYARINIQDNATKWRNWGEGDMALNVYVGGGDEAHRYDIGEWFPLTDNNGNFINDADIASYRDVPGLAVQRIDGALRVVLYGGHTSEAVGKELASGSIWLSKDGVTKLTGAWDKSEPWIDPIDSFTRVHDATVSDPENPLDSRNGFNGYINQYNPRFDNLRVKSDLFQFHMVVTTGSDGFYARYHYDIPQVEVPCEEVLQ